MTLIIDESRPIATIRHTATLALIFVALAVASSYSRAKGVSAGATAGVSLYLSVMAAEAGLVYYVWRGTRARLQSPLRDLIGPPWTNAGSAARDVLIAAAVWGVWLALQLVFDRIMPSGDGAPRGVFPHGLVHQSSWITMSILAGVAEELVFRGYFMRQLTALTGRAGVALVLQALLFGIAHGYEGLYSCLRIVAFGILFGLVALWQRNLRSCIIAHAWTDIAAGLLRI